MTGNSYRCSCGKVFKTAQGLAGHQRFCQKVVEKPKAEEHLKEWEQRLSDLERSCNRLQDLYAGALKKQNELERRVNLLIGYVCPGGENLVGINSSRIIKFSGEIDHVKKELLKNQEAFGEELWAKVWYLIPEQFRPKRP